ncbi:hypothetical protein SK128_008449, partial [Halocaridina rubra]
MFLFSDSEGEDDYLEEDVHVPDSDCDKSDLDDLSEQPPQKRPKTDGWKGRDKTWWKKKAPKLLGRNRSRNVIKFTQGLKGPALNANSPADLSGVFISPEIIGLFVKHTNSIIATKKVNYAQSCRTIDTDWPANVS